MSERARERARMPCSPCACTSHVLFRRGRAGRRARRGAAQRGAARRGAAMGAARRGAVRCGTRGGARSALMAEVSQRHMQRALRRVQSPAQRQPARSHRGGPAPLQTRQAARRACIPTPCIWLPRGRSPCAACAAPRRRGSRVPGVHQPRQGARARARGEARRGAAMVHTILLLQEDRNQSSRHWREFKGFDRAVDGASRGGGEGSI